MIYYKKLHTIIPPHIFSQNVSDVKIHKPGFWAKHVNAIYEKLDDYRYKVTRSKGKKEKAFWGMTTAHTVNFESLCGTVCCINYLCMVKLIAFPCWGVSRSSLVDCIPSLRYVQITQIGAMLPFFCLSSLIILCFRSIFLYESMFSYEM